MRTSFTTLGDLKAGRYQLWGHCGSQFCSRSRVLNLDKLIARLGSDYVYVEDSRISRSLVCEACGHKGGSITISPP